MKGYILAALAAALYGTNPVFATPLYATGMNSLSVVLCRYCCGLPLLAGLVFIFREELHLGIGKVGIQAILGMVMAISSWTLYESYIYMNPGIASTLLFMYPVLTATIMIVFFHEPFRIPVAISLFIMICGLYLLGKSPDAGTISLTGFVLVFVSALAYALYLVLVKVCPSVATMPAIQSLFWQLLFGALLYLAISAFGVPLTIPGQPLQWELVAGLTLFPTLLSLLCTLKAVASVGPTATGIFGALEPVTAVALSCIILGERLTMREAAGGILILAATLVVVATPVPGQPRSRRTDTPCPAAASPVSKERRESQNAASKSHFSKKHLQHPGKCENINKSDNTVECRKRESLYKTGIAEEARPQRPKLSGTRDCGRTYL